MLVLKNSLLLTLLSKKNSIMQHKKYILIGKIKQNEVLKIMLETYFGVSITN